MSLMVMKNYPPEFTADAVALVLSRPDRTITSIARDLGISRETLRVWVCTAQADEQLAGRIRRIHAEHDGTYGSPRMTAELRAAGITVNHKRVMREHGIAGLRLRKKVRTIIPEPDTAPVADLIQRDFTAAEPNARYVGRYHLPARRRRPVPLPGHRGGSVLTSAGGLVDRRPHAHRTRRRRAAGRGAYPEWLSGASHPLPTAGAAVCTPAGDRSCPPRRAAPAPPPGRRWPPRSWCGCRRGYSAFLPGQSRRS